MTSCGVQCSRLYVKKTRGTLTKNTMSATKTASQSSAASTDEGGVTSKPSPTSTWTPNADAAEWTPTFAVTTGPAAAKGGAAAKSAEVSSASAVEAGADGGSNRGTKIADGSEAKGDASVKADAKPAANGGGTSASDASSEHKADGLAAGAASGGGQPRTVTRYEVDFLLKMRPKIESTPKPAGLQPPDRVDILWDGKEPTPAKTGLGSLRGGIRPLPPLSGRVGSSRPGLGEARAAPPPLRGAQREMGRERDTRMDPRSGGGSGGGRDDRRTSGGGSGAGRGRGGGGGSRRVHIDTAPPLEDCKPIEINEATRWKPKSLESNKGAKEPEKEKLSVEEVLRKAIAILNKMTLEKFGKLSVAFMEVGCRDREVVSGVIDMIVEKAQMEHHFSSMYADLCERIARTPLAGLGEDATGKDAAKGSKKFRKMLLLKCQEEFEKDWQGLFAAVQNDPKLTDEAKTEREFVLKRKYTGHMRFVGELYKVELLKERHVLEAIHDMFGGSSGDEPDEERLECMVKLLQTCGSKLDSTGSPDTVKDMKRLFKRISKLAETRHISSRVRFMLRDLIELRNNRWVPRRAEEKAKTMQELHNDIAKEEESKNRAGGRGGGSSSRSGGGTSGSGSSSLRPGAGDARLSGNSRSDSSALSGRPTGQSQTAPKATPKDDDGWEVVPKKGGKAAAAGDGWSQVPSSRSRTGNPGSDERRGAGGAVGGGSLVTQTQQSAFALLGSQDEDTYREKKKKKKDSKEKKDRSSKKKDRSSSKSRSGTKSSSKASTDADGKAFSAARSSSPAPVKPPLPPPSGEASTMTEETARTKGKDIVAEYAMSGELEEACTCLSEIDQAVRWAAVSGAVNDAMERKQKHRDALAVVLAAGAKDGVLTEDSLMRGFNDVLDIVPDLCIDVPQATTYVAAAAASLVLGGYLDFGSLVASPCEGLLEGGKAAEFAVVTLSELKEAAKAEGMSEDDAAARVSELSRGNLDLAKLASMLPAICRGDEEKAVALLKRKGVSII
ncbi:unnamed protein product [Ascophyllum nodosum]